MATLAELRERLLRRPGMSGLTDQEADDLLAAAGETVQGYCGWQVWPRAVSTVTVDSYGADVVPLPSLMLHDVTSVETRPQYDLTPGAWEQVTSGWDWSEGGWLLRKGCWPDGPRRLRVEMDSGYEDPPGAVGNVLVALAAQTAAVPVGVSSEQAGGESVSYGTSGGSVDSGAGGMLTQAQRRVLDRYRLELRP